MKHAARQRRRPWLALCATAVVAFTGTLGASLSSFAANHADQGLPAVYVGERSFAGMTAQQISSQLLREAAQERVTVRVSGQTVTVPMSQTGIILDAQATAQAVVAPASSALGTLRTLVSPVQVSPTFSVDEATFASFVDQVNALTGRAPVAATAKVNEAGDRFEVSPSARGLGVDEGVLRDALVASLSQSGDVNVALDASEKDPRVDTETAQAVADQANAFLDKEFAIVTPREKVTPTAQEKVSWLEVTTAAQGQPELGQKAEAVTKWAEEVVKTANRKPINGIRHVDDQGNELELGRPAKLGTQITNGDAAVREFTQGVASAQPTSVSLSSVEVPAGMDDVVKPAGRERFAYQPQGKEKWVDVNLTYSTLTAYEGYTPVFGPVLINHGGEGHETVTGTYKVYLKYDKQDMGCTPEWEYCEKDVPSVSYWHQSYALHGAPWVKEFGIGTDETSHGCINIPPKDAEWIHGFTEIGTTVVTHY